MHIFTQLNRANWLKIAAICNRLNTQDTKNISQHIQIWLAFDADSSNDEAIKMSFTHTDAARILTIIDFIIAFPNTDFTESQ